MTFCADSTSQAKMMQQLSQENGPLPSPPLLHQPQPQSLVASQQPVVQHHQNHDLQRFLIGRQRPSSHHNQAPPPAPSWPLQHLTTSNQSRNQQHSAYPTPTSASPPPLASSMSSSSSSSSSSSASDGSASESPQSLPAGVTRPLPALAPRLAPSQSTTAFPIPRQTSSSAAACAVQPAVHSQSMQPASNQSNYTMHFQRSASPTSAIQNPSATADQTQSAKRGGASLLDYHLPPKSYQFISPHHQQQHQQHDAQYQRQVHSANRMRTASPVPVNTGSASPQQHPIQYGGVKLPTVGIMSAAAASQVASSQRASSASLVNHHPMPQGTWHGASSMSTSRPLHHNHQQLFHQHQQQQSMQVIQMNKTHHQYTINQHQQMPQVPGQQQHHAQMQGGHHFVPRGYFHSPLAQPQDVPPTETAGGLDADVLNAATILLSVQQVHKKKPLRIDTSPGRVPRKISKGGLVPPTVISAALAIEQLPTPSQTPSQSPRTVPHLLGSRALAMTGHAVSDVSAATAAVSSTTTAAAASAATNSKVISPDRSTNATESAPNSDASTVGSRTPDKTDAKDTGPRRRHTQSQAIPVFAAGAADPRRRLKAMIEAQEKDLGSRRRNGLVGKSSGSGSKTIVSAAAATAAAGGDQENDEPEDHMDMLLADDAGDAVVAATSVELQNTMLDDDDDDYMSESSEVPAAYRAELSSSHHSQSWSSTTSVSIPARRPSLKIVPPTASSVASLPAGKLSAGLTKRKRSLAAIDDDLSSSAKRRGSVTAQNEDEGGESQNFWDSQYQNYNQQRRNSTIVSTSADVVVVTEGAYGSSSSRRGSAASVNSVPPTPASVSPSASSQSSSARKRHRGSDAADSAPYYPTVQAAKGDKDKDSKFDKDAVVGGGAGGAGANKEKAQRKTARLPVLPPQVDMGLYRNTTKAMVVQWPKGGPMTFAPDTLMLDQLTKEEALLCRTLRLVPELYLRIKETVIAGTYTHPPFKKKEVRRWFPIDVNKINKLYDWFLDLGWIPNTDEEWESRKEFLRRAGGEDLVAGIAPAAEDD